jgi:hypothetical protein
MHSANRVTTPPKPADPLTLALRRLAERAADPDVRRWAADLLKGQKAAAQRGGASHGG